MAMGSPIVGLDNIGASGDESPHLNQQQFHGASGAVKGASNMASKLGRAAEIDAAGGGPEDPIGDIAAIGSLFT